MTEMSPKKIFSNDRNYLYFNLDDEHMGEYMSERVESCSLKMHTLDFMQIIKHFLKIGTLFQVTQVTLGQLSNVKIM